MPLQPVPCAADDGLQVRRCRLPTHLTADFFRACERRRRIAGTAGTFPNGYRPAGDAARHFDDFQISRAVLAADVVEGNVTTAVIPGYFPVIPAKAGIHLLYRQQMRLREIAHVNIVAARCAVAGGVIGAVEIEVRALALRHLAARWG